MIETEQGRPRSSGLGGVRTIAPFTVCPYTRHSPGLRYTGSAPAGISNHRAVTSGLAGSVGLATPTERIRMRPSARGPCVTHRQAAGFPSTCLISGSTGASDAAIARDSARQRREQARRAASEACPHSLDPPGTAQVRDRALVVARHHHDRNPATALGTTVAASSSAAGTPRLGARCTAQCPADAHGFPSCPGVAMRTPPPACLITQNAELYTGP